MGLEKRFAVKKLIDTPAVKSKLSPIRLPHAVTDYDKVRKGKSISQLSKRCRCSYCEAGISFTARAFLTAFESDHCAVPQLRGHA